jgi:hypothetical protein
MDKEEKECKVEYDKTISISNARGIMHRKIYLHMLKTPSLQ